MASTYETGFQTTKILDLQEPMEHLIILSSLIARLCLWDLNTVDAINTPKYQVVEKPLALLENFCFALAALFQMLRKHLKKHGSRKRDQGQELRKLLFPNSVAFE